MHRHKLFQKKNRNPIRIEGREVFIVNCRQSVLSRFSLGHKLIDNYISEIRDDVLCTGTSSFKQTEEK